MEKSMNVYEVLDGFLQDPVFRERYAPPGGGTFAREDVSAFLMDFFEIKDRKDAPQKENGFCFTVDSVTFRGNVKAETGKNGDNIDYYIYFQRNDEEVFTYRKKANGAADFLQKRVFGRTKDNVALYAVIALYTAAKFGIHTYSGRQNTIVLNWDTDEHFWYSAALLEADLLNGIWGNSKKSCYERHARELQFQQHLVGLLSPERMNETPMVTYYDHSLNTNGWQIEVSDDSETIETRITTAAKAGELSSRIAEEIIVQASGYPLLAAIMKTREDDADRIRSIVNLLKQICRIRLCFPRSSQKIANISVDIEICPIIDSTLQRFGKLQEFLSKNQRNYVGYDAFLFVGALAEALSKKEKHSFSDTEAAEYLKNYRDVPAETAEAMFRDLMDPQVGILTEDSGSFKFLHKQLRLVFYGVYDAVHENDRSELLTAYDLLERIRENSESNRKTPEHFRWRYDTSTFFGAAFLRTLTPRKREALLEGLCTIASDAAIGNRENQEKTISLLAFYLCEGGRYTGVQRERIFRAAYGRDLYPIQEEIWKYLGKDSFYRETVRTSLENACRLWEDPVKPERRYAAQDPYYIFLGWDAGWTWTAFEKGKQFLSSACICQHTSWHGNHNELNPGEVVRHIKDAVTVLKRSWRPDDFLYYVYGLNMLLLSLANVYILKNEFSTEMVAETERQIDANSSLLLDAVVLCDHATRKYNRTFNECGKESWKTDLCLLSGAVRFLCAYNGRFEPSVCFHMDKGIRDDYVRWYGNESRRWKILMARLLSYTDFFLPDDVSLPSEDEYCPEECLRYDNLPETFRGYREELKRRMSNLSGNKTWNNCGI